MLRNIFVCWFLLIATFSSFTQGGKLDWLSKVGAKGFVSSGKLFCVNNYGLVSDTVTNNSKAIQKAIDDCASKGGGVVYFRPGVYVTGAIFIKANVHLRIDEGVTILGSQHFSDYPDIDTRIAGIEMKWPAALINFLKVKNASISGEGVVNARGRFCWDKYWQMRKEYDERGLRWIVDYDVKRVRTVLVQESSDVTITGLTYKNAGFWTIQLLYSHHITVRGVIIRNNEDGSGPSTDGIDVDSSSWVLIENCDIDCNDDNFCLKAGRDWDGLRVNRPTEYVVIRKCIARRGAGLVTLGSETSGGIRNIYATDLSAKNTDNGLRIKSATTRGGVIENIYFMNSVLDSVKNVFQFNLNWYPAYSYSERPKGYHIDSVPPHWKAILQRVVPTEKGIPHAKNFFVSGIRATHAKNVFVASGLDESVLDNFKFINCIISAELVGYMEHCSNWIFTNTKISISKKAEQPSKTEGKEIEERLKG